MKEIQLTQGQVALVDDEDYEWLCQYKWYANKSQNGRYYAETWIENCAVKMHRLIMDAPDNMFVDHEDHEELNNQRYNLRICTRSQNGWNSKPNKGKKYKGTSFRDHMNKYQARASFEGKSYNLGHYDTEVEAALAYNAGAILLFGEFAYLNEVEGIDNEKFTEHILSF